MVFLIVEKDRQLNCTSKATLSIYLGTLYCKMFKNIKSKR